MRTKQQNPVDKPKIEDYEVEGALSDLLRAKEHQENPDLMKKVHALAGRKMKGIKSIQDLKDTYQEKFGK